MSEQSREAAQVGVQSSDELFPAVLRRPLSLWVVSVLPSALLALVNSFSFWLVWGEMKEPAQHVRAAALIASALLPGLAGLGLLPLAQRRQEGLAAWAQVSLGALGLAHLIAFFTLISGAMPRDTPDWIVGPSFCLAQLACMMPVLFIALWRLAGQRLRLRPGADFGLSLSTAFVVPVMVYVLAAAVSQIGRALSWKIAERLFEACVFVLLVVAPVVFFVALLRSLLLIRRFLAGQGERGRAAHMGYVGLVALVLPIAGLLLNKGIPFPADFQNPWPYALTVVNALALMAPQTGRRALDALVRHLRVLLFPFTLYFFVVFLPFLPFSILAILALGTGFLILAPTLLFIVHGQILKRDYEVALAAGAGRRAVWARTVLCLLILPLAFVARSEADRLGLRRALTFFYAPDYGQDAVLTAAPSQVRRVLLNVRRFKDGAEIPYLANWYNWRVFDNMLLQDEKVGEMWRLVVGGQPPQPAREDLTRDMFGSLFGGKTRTPETRGRTMRPVPRNVVLSDVQAAFSTTNGETETRVTLKVTSHDSASQAEYYAKLKVPPGVWVSGFKLKIEGKWQEGRVVERKAAEWVYRQIRDVSRRDPAILRYEDSETLLLRVFPVAPGETREVEVAFLCPEGFAAAVTVGDRHVALGAGEARPLCAWAEGLLAYNRLWRPPEGALADCAARPHLVLDCSAGVAWTDEALARSLQQAGGSVLHVTLANYETRTFALSGASPSEHVRQIRERLLPARGALDLAGVLRRIARRCRLQNGESCVLPEIVLAGPSCKAAWERVKPEQWDAFRNEMPAVRSIQVLGEKGEASTFDIPGAGGGPDRVALKSGSEVRLNTTGKDSCTVFTEGAAAPATWSRASRAWVKVADLKVPAADSRWAKGAAAWRAQRTLDEQPARDPLRREILKASRESGVLTPAGSYIVVENSAQWKMLEVKQRQTLAGDATLDLVESPAPRAWLLLALCLAALAVFRKAGAAWLGGDTRR